MRTSTGTAHQATIAVNDPRADPAQPSLLPAVEHRQQLIGVASEEAKLAPLTRTLRLPVTLDAGKTEANINDGVLTLRLAKAESARQGRPEGRAHRA